MMASGRGCRVLCEAGTEFYDQWVNDDTRFTVPDINASFDRVGSILLDLTPVNAG